MQQRQQAAIAVGRQAHLMSRFGPVGGDREALLARGLQFHRPLETARCDGNPRGTRGHAATPAEAAANMARHDPYVVRADAQLAGHLCAQAMDKLARFVDCQFTALPLTRRGEQFECIMVLGWRGVARFHFHRCAPERPLRIAHVDIGVAPRILGGGLGQRLDVCAGAAESGCGHFGLVHRFDQMTSFARGLERVGDDDGDDLADMPDLVALKCCRRLTAPAHGRGRFGLTSHIAAPQNVDYAGYSARFVKMHAHDPAACDGTGDKIGKRGVG